MKAIISIIAFAGLTLSSDAGENLITNGDFNKGPTKWRGDRKVVYETPAKQNKICKLKVDEGDELTFYQKINADGFKRLTLTYRVRRSEDYHSKDPDVPYYVNFIDEGRKLVSINERKLVSIGITKGPTLKDDKWTDVEEVITLFPSNEELAEGHTEAIPFDSTFGELSFTVRTGDSGYIMFDDISVTGE